MQFAILGTIEVRCDGRRVALGGPKQRALLAMLLLHANEVVSRDRLIEGLWGERAPATASRSLDSYVSRLRGALGGERIERRAPGYLVRVEEGELDLDRFEILLDRGRAELRAEDAAGAAKTLHEACLLWRGEALADVLYEPFAAREAARLDELRLLAVEERIDADLALGGESELVGELTSLVREHPFQERLLAQLMLALYRADRQAEALAVYRAGRQRMVEELGIEPGMELRGLQQRILEHDATLGAPARKPPRAHARRTTNRRTLTASGTAALLVAISVVIGVVLGIGGTSASTAASTSNQVVALTADLGKPSREIEVDAAPTAVVPLGDALWFADPSSEVVSHLDLDRGAVVDRVPVPSGAGVLVAGAGSLWAADVLGEGVSRIDPASGTVTQPIPLGRARVGALAFGENRLWVADLTDDVLIAIDPSSPSPTRRLQLELHPTSLAVNDGSAWVGDYGAGTIAEVDLRSGDTVSTIHTGNGPVALAVQPDAVWVVNSLDSTVSRVARATASVTATIPVGSGPSAIAVAEGSIWVANEHSRTVSRIDPASNAVVQTTPVGGGPSALATVGDQVWASVRPVSAHRGGTLVLQHTRPIAIDPALQLDLFPPVSDDLTRDGLVTYNHVAGPAGTQLVPDLAVSIPTPTDAGRTYTFRLRPGIRYSDGRIVKTVDFRRALERVLVLGSSGRDLFTGIVGSDTCAPRSAKCDLSRGVETHERARTVAFHLREADPTFLVSLTTGGLASPVPPDTPMRPGAFEPIPGTGPYKIASASSSEIRYVRNTFFREWSQAAKPDGNPDEIVMRFDSRLKQLVRAVEDGRADFVTDGIPVSMFPAIARRFPGQLHWNPVPLTTFFQLNATLAPFDDVRVRQALNLALDRTSVARTFGGNAAARSTCQVLPPGMRGFVRYCPYTRNPSASGAWTGPDLARGKRLVAASGKHGALVTVWAWTDDPFLGRPVAQEVAGALRRLGFRARVRLMSHAHLDSHPQLLETMQVAPSAWLDTNPYSFVASWLTCDGAQSHGWFCDRQLDQRMLHARSLEATDPRAAAALWAQIDRRLVDQAPWVPLVNPRSLDFVSSRVRNYQFHPYWGFLASQVWLE